MSRPATTGKKQGSRWPKGVSGNPRGRQKGARHAALLALDAIGSEAAREVLTRVVDAAKADDMRAAEILLRRVWPERKGRPVKFDLPAINAAPDVPKALSSVIAAMASGEISPDEASVIAGVIESKRKAIETEELDRRLTALEGARSEGTVR